MASFMAFCAGFMLGMGFVMAMLLSILGIVFTGLSAVIIVLEVTTKETVNSE